MKEERENVTIRPWSMEDAECLTGQISHPGVLRYLTARMPNPYHLEDAREYLTKSRDDGSFNRCVLVDGEIAGGIGLSATGLFGYWLGVRYHGRGIATRAVKLFLQEVPQYVPDCGKLIACVYEPNVASTRVLEKCGFMRVGFIEPQCAAWDGNVYRGVQFELEL